MGKTPYQLVQDCFINSRCGDIFRMLAKLLIQFQLSPKNCDFYMRHTYHTNATPSEWKATPYQWTINHNDPLISPYFLGRWHWGVTIKLKWLYNYIDISRVSAPPSSSSEGLVQDPHKRCNNPGAPKIYRFTLSSSLWNPGTWRVNHSTQVVYPETFSSLPSPGIVAIEIAYMLL